MSKYIIDKGVKLCGYDKLPFCIWDGHRGDTYFYSKDQYNLIIDCDGETEIYTDKLEKDKIRLLEQLETDGLIHKAEEGEVLAPEQRYIYYDNRYRDNVQISITGDCNYRCKHCFMSAPDAKFGVPSKEEIFNWIDQVAECGIRKAGITGGEPLIRADFEEIVRYMVYKGVIPVTLYTNGALVNERLLDLFEELHIRPSFAISFDGVGWHDWLRGIDGAEEMAVRAIKLAVSRGFKVGAAMCIHRKNADSIRETVKYLADIGCETVKFSRAMDEGCWNDYKGVSLSCTEALQIYYDYIDDFVEDGMPLGISMEGAFAYTSIAKNAFVPANKRKPLPNAREKLPRETVCLAMRKSLYISPEGVVIPCMGLVDNDIADKYESLRNMRLKDILTSSYYLDCSSCTVGDIMNHNKKCAECKFIEECIGGCRAAATKVADDFFAIDEELCDFYLSGWFEKFTKKCIQINKTIEEKGE